MQAAALVDVIFSSTSELNHLNENQEKALHEAYQHAFTLMLKEGVSSDPMVNKQWAASFEKLLRETPASQMLVNIALQGQRPKLDVLSDSFEKYSLPSEETFTALNHFADVLLLHLRINISDDNHPLHGLITPESLKNVEPYTALEYYKQLLPDLRATGDKAGEATILYLIGKTHVRLDRLRQALLDFGQALGLFHEVDNPIQVARTQRSMGAIHRDMEDMDEALTYFYDALVVYQRAGNLEGEASALNDIGVVYDRFDDNERALSYYSQSAKMHRRVGNLQMEATALHNIANIYNQLGDKQQAIIHYNKALPLRRKAGDQHGEAATVFNMSYLVKEKSHALKLVQQAHDLWASVGSSLAEELATPRLKTLQGG